MVLNDLNTCDLLVHSTDFLQGSFPRSRTRGFLGGSAQSARAAEQGILGQQSLF